MFPSGVFLNLCRYMRNQALNCVTFRGIVKGRMAKVNVYADALILVWFDGEDTAYQHFSFGDMSSLRVVKVEKTTRSLINVDAEEHMALINDLLKNTLPSYVMSALGLERTARRQHEELTFSAVGARI